MSINLQDIQLPIHVPQSSLLRTSTCKFYVFSFIAVVWSVLLWSTPELLGSINRNPQASTQI